MKICSALDTLSCMNITWAYSRTVDRPQGGPHRYLWLFPTGPLFSFIFLNLLLSEAQAAGLETSPLSQNTSPARVRMVTWLVEQVQMPALLEGVLLKDRLCLIFWKISAPSWSLWRLQGVTAQACAVTDHKRLQRVSGQSKCDPRHTSMVSVCAITPGTVLNQLCEWNGQVVPNSWNLSTVAVPLKFSHTRLQTWKYMHQSIYYRGC